MAYRFPDGFLWGAAASATQTEGASQKDGKAMNIWDYWYQIEPKKFYDQVGPENTSLFYEKYEEDIANMKKFGLNSFRTSLSWSRLLPDGRTVNPKAVAFYNDVIDRLLENGIEPIINLFHFDMPYHLQEKGGWENRRVIDDFAYYAEQAFQLFGDRVNRWTTFNEPIVPVEAGYLNDLHYPCVKDMKRAVQVGYHTMLASSAAIQRFRGSDFDGQIGIILNLTPSYARSDSPGDQEAAEIADLFFNRSFLDPSVLGHYPDKLIQLLAPYDVLPATDPEDQAIIANNTVDFLGVNYYQPRRVKEKEHATIIDRDRIMPADLFDDYIWAERKMNPYRGWEIYEKGIYDIAINIRDHYDNIPWYVAENGMGVQGEERFSDDNGFIHDDYRIDFYRDHLKWLHKGITEGSNCFGYHVWTFMDNWSWLNAYKNRYGLFKVDLDDHFQRTAKKSAYWFKDLATNNELME